MKKSNSSLAHKNNIIIELENLEYQVLKQIWDSYMIYDLENYINNHFNIVNSKKDVKLLLICFWSSGKDFEEELKKFENKEDLSSFLNFFATMENTIFSIDKEGWISMDVNTFRFPDYMSDKDIYDYLSLVRKPCFDYGLRIRRITNRECVTYWDKVFNITTSNDDERDVFGFDCNDLTYEEYNKKLRKVMR